MTDIEYRVADLLNFSSQQKPIDFEQTFNSLIGDRISSAIDQKKIEIAQRMFGAQGPESDIEDTEEDNDAEAA